MTRAGRLLTAGITIACTCVAAMVSAAQKSAPALPDWSGEWEMVGLTPSDGGLFIESSAEIAARWNRPPYNNDTQQAAFRDRIERGLRDASPAAPAPVKFLCNVGFPLLMIEAPMTFEILVTAKQTALVFSSREIRNIYTDERKHTPDDEIWPTWSGDSIGYWDGATLVIDTIAVSSPLAPPAAARLGLGTIIVTPPGSDNGAKNLVAFFSDHARYTERIRLLDSGLLEDELTVHDPLSLASPWVIARQYRRINGVNRMVFQDCEGDARHQIINGEMTLKLSP